MSAVLLYKHLVIRISAGRSTLIYYASHIHLSNYCNCNISRLSLDYIYKHMIVSLLS